MMQSPVVILSGGSEIAAVALVEEFLQAEVDVAVISLNPRSVLKRAIASNRFFYIPWPPEDPTEASVQIAEALGSLQSDSRTPLSIFPTEDGGLRLLLEFSNQFSACARFSRAHALRRLGGLDKAELFVHLQGSQCTELVAQTQILHSADQLHEAWYRFDGDFVLKPAVKPFAMRMGRMLAKVLMSARFKDATTMGSTLTDCWNHSDCWIAQQRLETPSEGEAAFWAVRSRDGSMAAASAVQKRKQPRFGGTACWVQTANLSDALWPIAARILEELDFEGLCELEFLVDKSGRWRLLELNPRAWLQVGLARAAGLPLAIQAARTLAGEPMKLTHKPRGGVSWVNAERLLMQSLSGEYGSRIGELRLAIRLIRQADMLAMYGGTLRGVRRRWIARNLRRLVSGLH